MLKFNYNHEEHSISFLFNGRMDSLAAIALGEIMQAEAGLKEISPKDKIVFDLKEVDYVASSFIRICVSQAKQVGPNRFSMINCQPCVKKTFKISGLDEMLNIS